MNKLILKICLSGMIVILGMSSPIYGQGIVVDSFESDFGSRVKVVDINSCGFDLFSSNNNSLGGIKNVGSFEYFDGGPLNIDEVRVTNTASTSGKIKFTTLRTNSSINTMEFRGGNNAQAVALQIIHSSMLPLQLKANGDMTIGGMLTENSDIRLKKDIVALSDVLPSLSKISAYRYNWNETKRGENTQLGLIAQEVQEVYPELVATSEDGTLSVAYANFSAVLLQATKELHELVKEQSIEIEKLKKEIAK